MIYRVPEYYSDFHCIADKCRDSCCIGWEIDVDPVTAAKYENISGSFGERLRENISDGCFILHEGDRCPFLNRNDLPPSSHRSANPNLSFRNPLQKRKFSLIA